MTQSRDCEGKLVGVSHYSSAVLDCTISIPLYMHVQSLQSLELGPTYIINAEKDSLQVSIN